MLERHVFWQWKIEGEESGSNQRIDGVQDFWKELERAGWGFDHTGSTCGPC